MKRYNLLLIIAAAALIPALAQNSTNPFLGRWDMTLTSGNNHYPSWLEVTDKGGTLEARVQQPTGNVAPVPGVRIDGSRLIVTLSAAAPPRPAADGRPAFPGRSETTWELTAEGGKLAGAQKNGDKTRQLTGVRAPALKAAAVKSWGASESLFNGKDLGGWEPINNTPDFENNPGESHWMVKNGELTNEAKGSNLRTTRTFNDFKLHVEFNCPPGENSGIYLRGRYEVQVAPPPDPAASGYGGTESTGTDRGWWLSQSVPRNRLGLWHARSGHSPALPAGLADLRHHARGPLGDGDFQRRDHDRQSGNRRRDRRCHR